MRLVLALIVCLTLPLAALAQETAPENPVIARMTALVQAYNAQDAASIAALYAPDAVLLAPGQASIQGREAIAQHYAQAFAAGARELQFRTFDIRGFDSNAVEIGETVVMVGDTRIVGRYMHLWEVMDGQIMLTRDMYHVLSAE